MPNEPSNGELQRLIERNHAENRDDILDLKTQVARDATINAQQMQQFVLRDVYAVEMAAMRERVARLEKEAESARAAVRGAIYAAVGSVLASIIAGVVLAMILKGGK